MFLRYKHAQIEKDLLSKMVLVAGPRQVGKTFMSQQIMPDIQEYLNYDARQDRQSIIGQTWNQQTPLLIFDEIHKMRNWKSWLKGIWDTRQNKQSILVTGSAKLDYFRKAGDSLAGRYYLHRLHPLSVAELKKTHSAEDSANKLLQFSGFPEPFLKADPIEHKRWQRSHIDRIIQEDIQDLYRVQDIKRMEILLELLAQRVGSCISYSNLARDLDVAAKTVKHWISILESMYIIFSIAPYTKTLSRSIRKQNKIYFYDITRVSNPGARLENLVACHLLKYNHYLEDHFGDKTALHYLRDKEKREVDFACTRDGKITSLIEVKHKDAHLSPALAYYKNKLNIKASVQLVHQLAREKTVKNIQIANLANYLNQLV